MTIINDGFRECLNCKGKFFEGNRLWLNPLCKDCWNQLESSKREDSSKTFYVEYSPSFHKYGLKDGYETIQTGCGTPNTIEI